MRSLRASQIARCSAIQRSACDSALGRSSQVRTRPTLLERITPLRSSTDRCFMNDGSAIAKGAASADTDCRPAPEHAHDGAPRGVGQGVEHFGELSTLVSH